MTPALSHRSPDKLLGAERARAVVPDALSFPRAAMRALVRGRYRVEKLRFELDADGRGEILYRLHGDGRVFHFFLVSDMLPEEVKTDRNFAASWDAMGVLCQGAWTAEREALLRREVPRQRAGFVDYDTLMYARGNRSARIFNHVVDCLADGRQPDAKELAPVGYILRTTAFIGNGQHGTLPLEAYDAEHPLRRPYYAQFCSAFMLREYVFDLVDHLARVRSPRALRLAPEYRRFLGLGNSAATGLAAYATNHPHKMNRWSLVHEDALVQALGRMPVLAGAMADRFAVLLRKAIVHFTEGARPDDRVFAPPQATAAALRCVEAQLDTGPDVLRVSTEKTISLACLIAWARDNVSAEACEVLHALVLELHPDIVDAAVDSFMVDEDSPLQPEATVADVQAMVERDFGWALQPAGPDDTNPMYFWYRASSAPRDVRRGLRQRLAHLEFETNMDFIHQLRASHRWLRTMAPELHIGAALCERPVFRHAIARAQSLAGARYASLRQPWLSASYTPFEAIRFVLAFFGMEKFEAAFPKSVRGTFLQGAPIAEDVAAGRDGPWPFTCIPASAQAHAGDVLAPLPATAGRASPVTVLGPAPQPDVLRLAPRELARALQVALQGHGMPLGVAVEAGALVAFAQHRGGPAVAVALLHCAASCVTQFSVPLAAQSWPDDGGPLSLHAHRASALATVPVALDLALARGLSFGRGTVRLTQVRDGWLARSVVLRGARKGVLTGVLWRAPGGVHAWALAGPAPDGDGWYTENLQAPSGDAVAGQLIDAAQLTALQPEDLLVVCLQPGGVAPPAGLPLASGARLNTDAARSGVPLRRADYEALLLAGQALLVPHILEHRVLHGGADPLKTF